MVFYVYIFCYTLVILLKEFIQQDQLNKTSLDKFVQEQKYSNSK